MRDRHIFVIAGLFALTAVMLGAFATHGLKPQLTASQITTFETGARFQFMHAIGLFIVGLLMQHNGSRLLGKAAMFMCIGIILFCGSLYLLSCKEILGITGWKWLGPITPLGGLSFMIGWLLLILAVWRPKPTRPQ